MHDCSTTGFLDGEQVPLRDVFNGTILPSGGESAYQLAVYTAGSMEAFVDMMNQKAAELGIGPVSYTHLVKLVYFVCGVCNFFCYYFSYPIPVSL